MAIRVLIADDQGMVRTGLRSLLEAEPDVEVIGEATNGEDAVATALRTRPDVVLMDIRMPTMNGLEATRQLVTASSDSRILLLSTYDLDEYVFEALRAGAHGFILKDATAEDLVQAVRVIAQGDSMLSPGITRRVVETFAKKEPSRAEVEKLHHLTTREREVLELVASGLTNAEIAKQLVVSEATAKTHVSSILSKLHLRDRVQAVILAYEAGIAGS